MPYINVISIVSIIDAEYDIWYFLSGFKTEAKRISW